MKKKRSSYKVRERYYAILQAAETLFGERGYQGVSIDEIARTAGVAKGLVNYHFGNKENLLVHVLSKGITGMFAELEEGVRTQDTAKNRVQATIELYLTMAKSGPALTRMAMTAVFETSSTEGIRTLWQDFMDKNLGRFSDLLEQGIANGEFKPMDTRLVTQMVMSWAFEVFREATVRKEPLDPKKSAEALCRILFEGICR
jgi:AcrR family transcriptional regulator